MVHPAALRVTVTLRLEPSMLVLDDAEDTPLPDEDAEAELLALYPPRACERLSAAVAASTTEVVVRPSAI